MAFYTAVGSRGAPPGVLRLISDIASFLYDHGYRFRSGWADGSDKAFQWGVERVVGHSVLSTEGEVYLPWNGFDGAYDNTATKGGFMCPNKWPNYDKAIEIASTIHPVWERLTRGPKAMHTRNVYQVLGQDLITPSEFIVYAAKPLKNGQVNGGTNMAVQLARRHNIPEMNLYYQEIVDGVREALRARSLEQFKNILQCVPIICGPV